jgi:uncharacterized protein (DUF362 family)
MRPGTTDETDPSRTRAVVAVGTGTDGDLVEALTTALGNARLASVLDETRRGLGPRATRIVIRPVLPPGVPRQTAPIDYVDPKLVEALVAWLRDRGRAEIAIAVPGPGGAQTARVVGYEHPVRDLTRDAAPFHYGGRIGDHPVSSSWKDADVRILVAKARTDRLLMYRGAIVCALGTIPCSDKLASRFAGAHDIGECAAEVLDRLPVTFGIIDAWHAADDASDGRGSPRETGAVLASSDLLALDWVLGELMGLDGPQLNPVVKSQLIRRGALDIDRWGDLTEWDPWRNPGVTRSAIVQAGAGRPWGPLAGWREVPWTAR